MGVCGMAVGARRYAMEESVQLAITLLDGAEYKPGCPLTVQRATFSQKGSQYVAKEKVVLTDEQKRRLELKRKDVYAVSLHPGTTATDLSAPFQKNVVPEKLFTAEYSAGAMLDVLDGLGTDDSGSFFAYDGSRIEF